MPLNATWPCKHKMFIALIYLSRVSIATLLHVYTYSSQNYQQLSFAIHTLFECSTRISEACVHVVETTQPSQ